jgi:serine/threonine protein phosphatase PrpC
VALLEGSSELYLLPMRLFGRGSRTRGLTVRRRTDWERLASRIDFGCATAIGTRPDNQDRCEVSPRWAIISDGAGGCAGGALAAELTVREVVARLEAPSGAIDEEVVNQAVTGANAAVRSHRAADAAVAAMAATLTLAAAAAVHADESIWLVVNVGDSPAWLAASHGFTRVTEEHNVAAELVRSGAISRDAAREHPGRHVVTRAMGLADAVMVDPAPVALHPGDQLLLASDGLEVLNEPEMQDVIRPASTARDAARRLVEAALCGGASDNVTVAVLRHLQSCGDARAAR